MTRHATRNEDDGQAEEGGGRTAKGKRAFTISWQEKKKKGTVITYLEASRPSEPRS